jgi:hypothetical protein
VILSGSGRRLSVGPQTGRGKTLSGVKTAAGSHIDRRVARLTAFWVFLGLGAFLVLRWRWILAFLFLDFLLRGFLWGRVSPLAALSRRVVASSSSPPQLQWAAPKVFAAKLGCFFTLVALLLSLSGADTAATVLAGCLLLLAGLEAFAGACVGCQIHSTLYRVGVLRDAGSPNSE